MYATGEYTQAFLAQHFGVSSSRIGQVINPELGLRVAQRHLEWQRNGTCTICGAICSRRYEHGVYVSRCRACFIENATSTVRPDTLKCGTCQRWLPDAAFSHSKNTSRLRRGRRQRCTQCDTAARRDYRERHKIPCTYCGTPVLHENTGGEPKCVPCYRKHPRKAA